MFPKNIAFYQFIINLKRQWYEKIASIILIYNKNEIKIDRIPFIVFSFYEWLWGGVSEYLPGIYFCSFFMNLWLLTKWKVKNVIHNIILCLKNHESWYKKRVYSNKSKNQLPKKSLAPMSTFQNNAGFLIFFNEKHLGTPTYLIIITIRSYLTLVLH